MSTQEIIVCAEASTRAWYTRIDSYFTSLGFTKSEANADLYHIVVEGKLLIILLYVDDLILTGDEKLIKSDEGHGAHALLSWHGGMAERWGLSFISGKVCQLDISRNSTWRSVNPWTHLVGNWRKEDATSREVVEATVYRQLVDSLMYLVNT